MKGLWKVAAAAVLMSVAGPAHAGFAGYRWQVTTIAHGGNPTSIPANDDVYLEFGPGGQFLANEPVNDHFGTYRQVGDGFTTGELGSTLAAYLGGDPVKVLARSAMSAFDGATASRPISKVEYRPLHAGKRRRPGTAVQRRRPPGRGGQVRCLPLRVRENDAPGDDLPALHPRRVG
jgi:hypothetical protein